MDVAGVVGTRAFINDETLGLEFPPDGVEGLEEDSEEVDEEDEVRAMSSCVVSCIRYVRTSIKTLLGIMGALLERCVVFIAVSGLSVVRWIPGGLGG